MAPEVDAPQRIAAAAIERKYLTFVCAEHKATGRSQQTRAAADVMRARRQIGPTCRTRGNIERPDHWHDVFAGGAAGNEYLARLARLRHGLREYGSAFGRRHEQQPGLRIER